MKNSNHSSTRLIKHSLHCLVCTLFACVANAATNPPEQPLTSTLSVDINAAYNPAAVAIKARAFTQYTYHRSRSPLWNDLYVQAGVQNLTNPAFISAGGHIEWMPIAIFKLRAQYDHLFFNGAFGSLLDFATAGEAYGDEVQSQRRGSEVTGHANRFSVHPTLRAKAGRFIFRNAANFYRLYFPEGGPFYLDKEYDILVGQVDTLVSNKLFLMYDWGEPRLKQQKLGGLYYEYTHSDKAKLTRQRLGVIWFQSPFANYAFLDRPRWYILSAYNLTDRNRGQSIYLALGIGADLHF